MRRREGGKRREGKIEGDEIGIMMERQLLHAIIKTLTFMYTIVSGLSTY